MRESWVRLLEHCSGGCALELELCSAAGLTAGGVMLRTPSRPAPLCVIAWGRAVASLWVS